MEVQVVWIWSRSTQSAPNQSAPNALLDSVTSLPSIGSWAGRPSPSTGPPVREATRDLGLKALFQLKQQAAQKQRGAQNTTVSVSGFIGGKEATFTIEAFKDEPPLNRVDQLSHTGQDGRLRMSYDDFLLRQGPYWHKALMCAIANNINLVGRVRESQSEPCAIADNINPVGRESQYSYHYARVSLAIDDGPKYQWILHAQVSQVSTVPVTLNRIGRFLILSGPRTTFYS